MVKYDNYNNDNGGKIIIKINNNEISAVEITVVKALSHTKTSVVCQFILTEVNITK